MTRKSRFLLVLLVAALALTGAGCASASRQVSTQTPAPKPSETAFPTAASPTPTLIPTEFFTPTLAPPEKTHYTIEAVLDYDAHQLQVKQHIRYVNRSTDLLTELILMVDPLYYPGTFQLESLHWGDGGEIVAVQQETGWLRFSLPQPLAPGQPVEIDMVYQLKLPAPVPSASTRPVPFGYTARQTNLVDWYPFIPPYLSGKGWINHPASYYGEHLAYESADFEVSIRLSEPRPNLIVAASAPPLQDGDWQRFKLNGARSFAWSISPYYQVLTAQSGRVQVSAYAFGGQEQANQAVLDTTVKALEYYTKLFGPYPHPTMSVVEADFLDGMEYDGLYFLSKGFYNLYKGTPAEYLIAIAAHETAHQWWYGLVGNDQALEPWLDEALSTYSERLYYENVAPEALAWWWDYRVNYYQPHGWVDTTIYNPFGDNEPYRSYRDAVYLNGAVFLEELRKTIGDEAFFAFLKEYTARLTGQISSLAAFENVLKEFTHADLEDLMKKYFNHP